MRGERVFKAHQAHRLEDPERKTWLPVTDVLRASAIHPGMRIADVGAGTGYFAIPMAHAIGPAGKVYAVDLQPEMLKLLRAKLETPDAPRNIELVQGDAGETSLPTASVDLVLIANVWHELDDREAALKESARILSPNGLLAVLDWRADMDSPPGPPANHRLTEAEVTQFLMQHDWTTKAPLHIGTYSYFLAAQPPMQTK